MLKDGFLTKAMFYLKEFFKSFLVRGKKLLEITFIIERVKTKKIIKRLLWHGQP